MKYFVALLILTASAWATTYHVDNCLDVGSDLNSGTSPAAAWRTVAKVNASSFSAGDSILFNKGCTWREQLIYPSSGSVGNPITFGTYGTGTAPILSGSHLITEGWSQDSTHIWKTTVTTQPSIVYFDGSRGTLVGSKATIVGEFNWFWSANVLYVWSPSDSDPGQSYTSPGIEAGALNFSVVRTNDTSFVTFDGITVRDGNDKNHANIQVGPNSVVGQTLQNCVAERGAGSGIILQGTVTAASVTVNNCTIQNNEAWGIAVSHQYTSGTISNNTITGNGLNSVANNQEYSGIDGVLGNFNIFRNTISNDAPNRCKTKGRLGTYCHAIYYSSGFGGDLTQEANIYQNSISGSTNGVGIKVVGSASVYQNLVYGNDAGGIATGQNGTTNVVYQVYSNIVYNNNKGNIAGSAGISEVNQGSGTISLTLNGNTLYQNAATAGSEVLVNNNIQNFTMKNNILFGSSGRPTFETGLVLTGTVSIDHNLYWRADGNASLFVKNAPLTWAQWKALGYDAHGVNANPRFSNASGDNFRLTSGSPAIYAGSNLDTTYRLAADPASASFPWDTVDQDVVGPAWTIGTFAFTASGTGNVAAAPTNLTVLCMNKPRRVRP